MSGAAPSLEPMISSPRGSDLWQRLQGLDAEHPSDWQRPGPSRRALRTDVIVALIAVGLMVFSNWAVLELRKGADPSEVGALLHDEDPAAALVGMVLVPAMYGVAIALRRRFPLWMLVLSTVAFVSAFAFTYLDTVVTQIGYFLLIFTAGAWSNQRVMVTLLRIAITVGMTVWAVVDAFTRATLLFAFSESSDSENWISSVFTAYTLLINVLYFIGAFWFGNSDYRRAGQRAALEERTRELEEYAEALADERKRVGEQAIRLDRVRIARELHDVEIAAGSARCRAERTRRDRGAPFAPHDAAQRGCGRRRRCAGARRRRTGSASRSIRAFDAHRRAGAGAHRGAARGRHAG
jgi:hypothetical protein